MNETTNDGSSSTPGSSSPFGVPAAIVIAGGLIAAALYFSGGGGVPAAGTTPSNDAAVAVDAGAGQVAGQAVGDIRPVDDTDLVRGATNAKVTIIEYSDLECPFCKRFHPTLRRVLEEYPDDVRWVYRHFPIQQLHSKAPAEANAVECAGEQGKAWELLDLIFEITPGNNGLDLETLPALAQQVGVADIDTFKICVETGKYADEVEADLADAALAGGRGTPYSVIIGPDGQKIPLSGAQPFEAVKAQIEALL